MCPQQYIRTQTDTYACSDRLKAGCRTSRTSENIAHLFEAWAQSPHAWLTRRTALASSDVLTASSPWVRDRDLNNVAPRSSAGRTWSLARHRGAHAAQGGHRQSPRAPRQSKTWGLPENLVSGRHTYIIRPPTLAIGSSALRIFQSDEHDKVVPAHRAPPSRSKQILYQCTSYRRDRTAFGSVPVVSGARGRGLAAVRKGKRPSPAMRARIFRCMISIVNCGGGWGSCNERFATAADACSG